MCQARTNYWLSAKFQPRTLLGHNEYESVGKILRSFCVVCRAFPADQSLDYRLQGLGFCIAARFCHATPVDDDVSKFEQVIAAERACEHGNRRKVFAVFLV